MCEYINEAIIQEDFTMEKTIYDESNGLWYELLQVTPWPIKTNCRQSMYGEQVTCSPFACSPTPFSIFCPISFFVPTPTLTGIKLIAIFYKNMAISY